MALLLGVLDRGREDDVVEEVGNGEERGLDATAADVLELVDDAKSEALTRMFGNPRLLKTKKEREK